MQINLTRCSGVFFALKKPSTKKPPPQRACYLWRYSLEGFRKPGGFSKEYLCIKTNVVIYSLCYLAYEFYTTDKYAINAAP